MSFNLRRARGWRCHIRDEPSIVDTHDGVSHLVVLTQMMLNLPELDPEPGHLDLVIVPASENQ
jgi:hypothetical protein